MRAFALFILIVACLALRESSVAQTKRPSQSPLTARDIYAKYRGAMVQIKVSYELDEETVTSSGCGFFYRSPNTIVTAYHVIQDAESLTIVNAHGAKFQPATVAYSALADVAVITVANPTKGPVLAGKTFAQIAVGETAFVIGNPLGLFPDTISQGIVGGKRKIAGTPCVQMSAAISEGNSGGPLFDDRGRVMGVVDAFMKQGQNNNLAIAMNEVDQVLSSGKKQAVAEFLSVNATPVEIVTSAPEARVRPGLIVETIDLEAEVISIDISPNGKMLAMCSMDEVALVALPSGRTLGNFDFDSEIQSVAFKNDEELAIFFDSGLVQEYRCDPWTRLKSHAANRRIPLPRMCRWLNSVFFASCTLDEKAKTPADWRLEKFTFQVGESSEIIPGFGVGNSFALDREAKFAIGAYDNKEAQDGLAVLDLAKNHLRLITDAVDPSTVMAVAISPDASTVATALVRKNEKSIRTFDIASGAEIRAWKLPELGYASFMAYVPSGSQVLIADPDYVRALDLNSGRTEFEIECMGSGFAASTDGKTIAVPYLNRVHVYSLVYGATYVGKWDVSSNGLDEEIEFMSDGTAVYTAVDVKDRHDRTEMGAAWVDRGNYVELAFTSIRGGTPQPGEKPAALPKGKKAMRTTWLSNDSFVIGSGKHKVVAKRKP